MSFCSKTAPAYGKRAWGIIAKETTRAAGLAAARLEYHGELDSGLEGEVRARQYSEEQVLGDWWPEDKNGVGDGM